MPKAEDLLPSEDQSINRLLSEMHQPQQPAANIPAGPATNPHAFLSRTARNTLINSTIIVGPLAAVTMGYFLAPQNLERKLSGTEMIVAFIILSLLMHGAFGTVRYRCHIDDNERRPQNGPR